MPSLELRDVGYRREGRAILSDIDWTVEAGESWIVLGRNGCGKTTLARIATLWEHPSSGTVSVLGEQLGHTDVRALRERVALVSAAMTDMVRARLTAAEVVVCALHGALEPWWHTYTATDHERARHLLAEQGVGDLSDREFGRLSSGERQRVLLARALMAHPGLVVLDEPNAGLDLGGREELVDRLDVLAADDSSAPMVLVTHHVEEIPPAFTHLLALRSGEVMTSGPIEDVLTAEMLSECFGVSVVLRRHQTDRGTRWNAHRS